VVQCTSTSSAGEEKVGLRGWLLCMWSPSEWTGATDEQRQKMLSCASQCTKQVGIFSA